MSAEKEEARFVAGLALHLCVALGKRPHNKRWYLALAGQIASRDPHRRSVQWWEAMVASVSECMLNDEDHLRFARANLGVDQEPASS